MSHYADILACTNLISEANYAVTIQRIRAEGYFPDAAAKLDAADRLLDAARKLVIDAGDCIPLGEVSTDFQIAAE